MAEFLDTTGISYKLEQMIKATEKKLVLISPFLKLNKRIREHLAYKSNEGVEIQVIYGKKDLNDEEFDWLKKLPNIKINFCENLHAKCYLNESKALITSMNLYNFSQANNNEMGIYTDKNTDANLFNDVGQEVKRLTKISEEKIDNINSNNVPEGASEEMEKEIEEMEAMISDSYCIRCADDIAFDLSSPYYYNCYQVWKKFKDPDYEENFSPTNLSKTCR